MKNLFRSLAAALALTVLAAAVEMPKSVIHIVNVKFKADASKADIDAAINGIGEMAKKFPDAGIERVWVKAIKNQLAPNFTHILVMEFKSEQHLQKYANSAAQKFWYEKYMKVRDESRTNDVTN
jgi:antibiotic biosynthesis monooxygenase (ABM) superfamily enzyme